MKINPFLATCGERTAFLFFLAFAISLHLIGLRWGLPDVARLDLLLSPESRTPELYQEMVKSRDALFENAESIFATDDLLAAAVKTEGQGNLPLFEWVDGRGRGFLLSLVRSYLIRTYEPDLANIMNAFASIHPGQLDFFPNTFSYGLVFLFIYGSCVYVISLLTRVPLENDLLYYLTHLSDLANVYLCLRIVNLAVVLLTAYCLLNVLYRFTSKRIASWCTVLFLCLPSTVVMNYELKPHSLGALFILLMLSVIIRIEQEGFSCRAGCLAGFLGALAYGCVPTNFIYSAVLFLAAIVVIKSQESPLQPFEIFKIGGSFLGPFFLLSVLLSVYAFLYPDVFWQEVGKQQRFYMGQDFSMYRLIQKFLDTLEAYLGIPLTAMGIAGLGIDRKRWPLWTVCFGVLLCLFMKFSQVGMPLRFLLPLVPLCLFGFVLLLERIRKTVFFPGASLFLFFLAMLQPGYAGLSEAVHFYYDGTAQATRIQAGRWINQNLKQGTSIGVSKTPMSFNSPPFRYENFRLSIFQEPDDLVSDLSEAPQFVLLSNFEEDGQSFAFLEFYQKIAEFRRESPFLYRKRFYPIADGSFSVYKRREDGLLGEIKTSASL